MILHIDTDLPVDTSTIDALLTTYPTSAGHRRDALTRELADLRDGIDRRRIALQGDDGTSGLLGAGMDYLDTREDAQREAIWMAWLAEYEACCDLIPRIAGVLDGEAT